MTDQLDLHPIPRAVEGEPKVDVIFVHGLGGDPFATWWHDPDKPRDSWPFWVAEDLPEAQLHCLGYPADWTHWFSGEAMPLFDRAKSVLNLMAARDLGGRPIVFICHSLGGLVVKQLLRQADERGAEPIWRAIGEQTRGVAFVATPHAGADLARVAERLGLVTQTTPVMADLSAHAPALRGLNEWFRDYVPRTGLRVLCRYETCTTGTKRVPMFGRWLGSLVSAGVKVVEEADADPGVPGVTPIPLDADHFGTCRPDRRDRPLCQDVLRLVRGVLGEAKPVTTPSTATVADRDRSVRWRFPLARGPKTHLRRACLPNPKRCESARLRIGHGLLTHRATQAFCLNRSIATRWLTTRCGNILTYLLISKFTNYS